MANMKEQHVCMIFGFRPGKQVWEVHERSKHFSLMMPLGTYRLLNGFSQFRHYAELSMKTDELPFLRLLEG